MSKKTYYDIIADVHGRFDKLELLMERLGYRREGDGFVPPEGRCALFLGDLIDPKPRHAAEGGVRATLKAVKRMCERGDALCVMGNHELNAILFHSKGADGAYLREHSEKNVRMHRGTVADFPDSLDEGSEWMEVWMPWLKSLPFFLDLGGLRAVHACWDEEMMAVVEGKSLHDEVFLRAAGEVGSREYEALEILLKGREVHLPEGVTFKDHTGTERNKMRARWWVLSEAGCRYRDLVFPANPAIPEDEVGAEVFGGFRSYPVEVAPVFFGHYYKDAAAEFVPERGNIACLDHAAALEGPLVAYRWEGESELRAEGYCAVNCSEMVV